MQQQRFIITISGVCTLFCAWATAQETAGLSQSRLAEIQAIVRNSYEAKRTEDIQRQLERLRNSPNAADRAVSFSSLLSLKLSTDEALAAYVPLLEHPAGDVKEYALEGLRAHGGAAKSAGAKIFGFLQHRDTAPNVVNAAALALATIDPAHPGLVSALVSRLSSPNIPKNSKELLPVALGLIGPAAQEALPTLTQLLDDPNTAVQIQAFHGIGKIANLPAPAGLSDLATFVSASPAAQHASLRRSSDDFLIGVLRTSKKAHVNCLAMEALGNHRQGRVDAIKAMLDGVASSDAVYSSISADALRQVDDRVTALVAPLTEALAHPNQKVRHQAAVALTKFGPRAKAAAPALGRALREVDDTIWHHQIGACLDALRAIGPGASEVSEVIVALLAEASPIFRNREKIHVHYLRAYMLVTLADIGVPDSAKRHILDALANGDGGGHHLYTAGAIAAGNMGARGADAIALLTEGVQSASAVDPLTFEFYFAHFSSAPYTTPRVEAVRALGKIGRSASAAAPVLERLVDEDLAPDPQSQIPSLGAEARKALLLIQNNSR